MFCRRMKLRIRRPALTSSTSDSATSATTSPLRIRRDLGPLPWRPPSRKVSSTDRDVTIAGTNPKSKPVASASAIVAASIDGSSET